MDTSVVLDCDWFIINKQPFVKVLSWSMVGSNNSGKITFDLPEKAPQFGRELSKQAHHSHGLLWWEGGEYPAHHVPKALSSLFDYMLRKRPSEIEFFAKGLQKCQLLETWLPTVTNLEDLGCPRFDQLSDKPLTTRHKAEAFSSWLQVHKSATLSPPVTSDVN